MSDDRPADHDPAKPPRASSDDEPLREGLTGSPSRPAQAEVTDADHLEHYLRLHLAGAAAGIELFGRGDHHGDEEARRAILHIRDELREEREQLLRIANAFDVSPAMLAETAARVGEHVARLKPNGDLISRSPLSDLVDLEAMRDAVAGKIAGWQALLTVTDRYPALDRDELTDLLAHGERQHAELVELHARAARSALG